MNICLCSAIFPPDIGGPATFIPRLAAALLKKGHGVKVVAVSKAAEAKGYDFPVHLIARSTPRILRLVKAAALITREAADCDLIFANNLELPAYLASIFSGKPFVLKIVGDVAWERARLKEWTNDSIDDFQGRRYGPRIELLKFLRSWLARQAKAVVTPSRYLQSLVLGWGVDGINLYYS